PPTTAVDHTAARNSQIVAPVSGTHDLSVAGILALIEQALTVQATAGATDTDTTILEIPAGLTLSPGPGAIVTAAAAPFTVGDTTELWLADISDPAGLELLAIENLTTTDLTNAIPTAADRDNLIVNTTAGPLISAPELSLSSSGAFARLEGEWPGQTLIGYRQHITTGRDISVEVESTGYIAPFGIRAAITTTTERIFTTDTANELTSAMRLERYLTILEPTVDLGGRDHQEDGGRRNLWSQVVASADESRQVVLTPVADGTGDIPGVDDITYIDDGSDVTISYVATDRNGDEVAFTLPCTYIGADDAHQSGATSPSARFADVWNGGSRDSRRDIDVNGQRVAFADAIAPGQTSKTTNDIRFNIDLPEVAAPGAFFGDNQVPAFNPALDHATIVDEILGDGQPFDVELHPRWLSDGVTNANFDLAFLRLPTVKVGTIGGDLPTVAVAAIEIVGEILNQVSGPAPDLPNPNAPWDPAEALGDASKILGSLLLSDLMVIKPVRLAVPGIDIPNTEVIVTSTGVTIIYSFKPELQSVSAVGFVATPNVTQCCVSITNEIPFEGQPTSVTETVVNDFSMEFPPGNAPTIIEIVFEEVRATVSSTSGLSVVPKISEWKIGDDLNLLQPLFDLLLGLDGINVDINPDALDLGASINLPSFNLGLVSINNFGIDFSMALPLGDNPVMLGTGIGSPANPLEVSAGIFGGTFFTTLDLEFHNSRTDWLVEAGISLFLEVGIDAVVVSASVRLSAGINFIFQNAGGNGTVIVTAGVSLEGGVSVLGLIDVSVKLSANLSYNSSTEIASGKATVHWGVDTFLGGIEGKVPIGEIEFVLGDGITSNAAGVGAGAAGAPRLAANNTANSTANNSVGGQSVSTSNQPRSSFGDLISQADWTQYSNAFA
ncbi:MAG: hypothetical protein AAGA65_19580, partial [Actinomycetota bacterium]